MTPIHSKQCKTGQASSRRQASTTKLPSLLYLPLSASEAPTSSDDAQQSDVWTRDRTFPNRDTNSGRNTREDTQGYQINPAALSSIVELRFGKRFGVSHVYCVMSWCVKALRFFRFLRFQSCPPHRLRTVTTVIEMHGFSQGSSRHHL